jgi:hypothetical protein
LKRIILIAAVLFPVLAIAACAGVLPVPGGSEQVNEACFESETALRDRLNALTLGMDEEAVLNSLCGRKEDIARIDRRDIRVALLGGDNVPFPSGNDVIEELYGYRISFKSVKKKHGFSSPIRIRTDASGYSYAVTVVFRAGKLYALPAVAGGPVNNSSSGTLFDALTPGAIVNHAMP